MSNSLGKLFTITVFGESHGEYVSAIVDGCPAGLRVEVEHIQKELNKRKPMRGSGAIPRREKDEVKIISGIFKEYTTGAPICLLVRNKNTDSAVYENMLSIPRPGHADYTAAVKYSGFNDFRGGGVFSGRMTAAWVMAGAIALKLLEQIGVEVLAHTVAIGEVEARPASLEYIRNSAHVNPYGCADPLAAAAIRQAIKNAQQEGDSLGGIVESIALNIPAGLGEPICDTVEGELAKALFCIPAVKGVEFGSGFAAALKKGSANNDRFSLMGKNIITLTNNSGGILGGISDGMPLVTRVAFKPTSSISKEQETLDLNTGKMVKLSVQGRHDVCIVPRAVVVVKCLTAIVLCDLALRAQIIPRVIR